MITDPNDRSIGTNRISNNQSCNDEEHFFLSYNRGGCNPEGERIFQGIRIIMNVTDMNKLMKENNEIH